MAYETLGCKVNQYETEAMRELMEQAGYETVDFSEKADIFLINTCTVTAIAEEIPAGDFKGTPSEFQCTHFCLRLYGTKRC